MLKLLLSTFSCTQNAPGLGCSKLGLANPGLASILNSVLQLNDAEF